jgi:hypothetical protein
MAAPSFSYAASGSDAFARISANTSSPQIGDLKPLSGAEEDFFERVRELSSGSSEGRAMEQPLFKWLSPKPVLPPSAKEGFCVEFAGPKPAAASTGATGFVDDDEQDDNPALALSDMRDQFNRFAHKRRELVDAVPFSIAGAPANAHAAIAAWDRTAWSTAPAPAAETQLTPAQAAPADFESKPKSSNVAAAIAKSRAASSGAVIIAASSSTKRAAQRKKKRHQPVTPMVTSQPEPADPTPAEYGKLKQTILAFDNTPEGYRTAVDDAIKEGLVDGNDKQAIAALMERMASTKNIKEKDRATELERHVQKGDAIVGRIQEEVEPTKASGTQHETGPGTSATHQDTSTATSCTHQDNDVKMGGMDDDQTVETGGTQQPSKPVSDSKRLKGKARKAAKEAAGKK